MSSMDERRAELRAFLDEDPGSRGMRGHVENDARLTIIRLRAALDAVRVRLGAVPGVDLSACVARLIERCENEASTADTLLENGDRIAREAEAMARSAVLAEREACRNVARDVQIEHLGEAARAVGSASHGLAGCKAAVAERIADAIGARK